MKKLLIILALLIPYFIFADKTQELPQSGTLATTSNGRAGNHTNDGPWGGINLHDQDSSPITARVVRHSEREYKVVVTNNTEDYYKASMSFTQYRDARRLSSSNFTASLKAGDSKSRRFRKYPSATNADVKLLKWKSKPKGKSVDQIKAEIAKKEKELEELRKLLPSDA